jgi:trehalose 6-phosphate phosphatase
MDPARLAQWADRTALFLDFDGTLAPIVDDPERAVPLPGVASVLGRLVQPFLVVALISARPVMYLASRVPADGVRYVGLYGIEEMVDGEVIIDPKAKALEPAVRKAREALAEHPVIKGAGAYVEDKGLAVAVHVRRIQDLDRWLGKVRSAVRQVADQYGLELLSARLAWELRPPIDTDKGSAVRRVVAESKAELIIVVGDDIGDLPAFHAAATLAGPGQSLRVAVSSPETPPALLEESDHVVEGPEGVVRFLELLANAAKRP